MTWLIEVQQHFSKLGATNQPRGPLKDVVALLASGEATPAAYREIVRRFGVQREPWFRREVLDLVLGFVSALLQDQAFNRQQQQEVARLKELLEIGQGEFANLRSTQVAAVLEKEFERILEDGTIDSAEEFQLVELQRAFDLGYDQFLEFMRVPIERAWEEDTARTGRQPQRSLLPKDRDQRLSVALESLYLMARTK